MTESIPLKYIPLLIDFLGFVPWCRTPYQKSLGESIRAARELQGLTQLQLGQRVRTSPGSVIRIEKNQGQILPATLKRILETLGISGMWEE